MQNIGFIGYGHMGSILVKSLLSTKAIKQEQLIISTRTQNKLEELKSIYPDIIIAENNIQ
jgi:pyrroline-5-carboxylate reductase